MNHYVFTFHDSTFECVAASLEVVRADNGPEEQYTAMCRLLGPVPKVISLATTKPTLRRRLQWWVSALSPFRL
ncbi:MAG: hypothetical protein U0Q16_38785 [Bryobacteraceae bacterium]